VASSLGLRADRFAQLRRHLLIAVRRAYKLSVTLLHMAVELVMGLLWGRRRYAPMIKHDYRPAKTKPVTADQSRSGGWVGGWKA
jgi:hypothetical protein